MARDIVEDLRADMRANRIDFRANSTTRNVTVHQDGATEVPVRFVLEDGNWIEAAIDRFGNIQITGKREFWVAARASNSITLLPTKREED